MWSAKASFCGERTVDRGSAPTARLIAPSVSALFVTKQGQRHPDPCHRNVGQQL